MFFLELGREGLLRTTQPRADPIGLCDGTRRDSSGWCVPVPVPAPLLFVVVVAELSGEATAVGKGKKQKRCFSWRWEASLTVEFHVGGLPARGREGKRAAVGQGRGASFEDNSPGWPV